MRRRAKERDAFRTDEELLALARPYLSDAFPNPERSGCPPDDALRMLAIRPRKVDESVSAHLTTCSPCFSAYMGHLATTRTHVRRASWVKRSVAAVGVAAAVTIVVLIFMAKFHSEPVVPRNPSVELHGTPDVQRAVTYIPIFIDLSNAATRRGSRGTATHKPPVIIPSGSPVALSLRLPFASKEGGYEITLSSGERVLWVQQSRAKREHGDTLLEVHADFKDVPEGDYLLQVSSSGRHLKTPVVIAPR